MRPLQRPGTRPRALILGLGTLLALVYCTPARAQITLQNDGWSSGQTAGFQSGFVAGEEGAATMGPVSQGVLLNTVQFLFGGQATAASVTLRIYEEVGTAEPGTMLHQETLFITGSDQILQEVDVAVPQIYIPAGESIRISFRFVHNGLPSIARDSDGNIGTERNWINASGIGWVDAQWIGLTGDFVIRALVLPSTGPGSDAGLDAGPGGDGGVETDGGELDAGVAVDGSTSADAAAQPDGGTDPVGCQDSSGCEGGYACLRGDCLLMCFAQDECPDDTLCHQGVCAPRCEDSSECDGGQVCENALCVDYCTGDDECLAGEECREFRCRVAYTPKKGCGCAVDPELRAIALPALLLLGLLLMLARRLRSTR